MGGEEREIGFHTGVSERVPSTEFREGVPERVAGRVPKTGSRSGSTAVLRTGPRTRFQNGVIIMGGKDVPTEAGAQSVCLPSNGGPSLTDQSRRAVFVLVELLFFS